MRNSTQGNCHPAKRLLAISNPTKLLNVTLTLLSGINSEYSKQLDMLNNYVLQNIEKLFF
jgi:hypothetical protein